MTAFPLLAALAAAFAQPGDFVLEEESELLEFSYGWPAEADALPALRAVLRSEMVAERAQAIRWAREGRDNARDNGIAFAAHYFAKGWEVAGSTPQLLSLTATEETFAGGAHGNIAFSALLWDRAADRPLEPAVLLGAVALERMRGRYCAALDAERAERRGAPVRPDPRDPHTLCPPLAGQVLAPRDGDGNGRFEAIDVLIAPYVAGAYAEGAYFAEIPLEADDLTGIEEAYWPEFEIAVDRDAAARDE
jgi:hypothetical protein